MSWPRPEPGLVIRYAYLWADAAAAGREDGSKDRPCAIVLTSQRAAGRARVFVLPITHARPRSPEDGIELPAPVKARLGLDAARSWIILAEGNDFLWPGPDLRPLPGAPSEGIVYGLLPPGLFAIVRARFVARARSRRARLVLRTE